MLTLSLIQTKLWYYFLHRSSSYVAPFSLFFRCFLYSFVIKCPGVPLSSSIRSPLTSSSLICLSLTHSLALSLSFSLSLTHTFLSLSHISHFFPIVFSSMSSHLLLSPMYYDQMPCYIRYLVLVVYVDFHFYDTLNPKITRKIFQFIILTSIHLDSRNIWWHKRGKNVTSILPTSRR